MNEPESNFSRMNRKRGRNRSNKILNILTGVVVLLIIIVAIPIFTNSENDKSEQVVEKKPLTKEEMVGGASPDSTQENSEQAVIPKETEVEDIPIDSTVDETSSIVEKVTSDDPNVVESIIDSSWTPIGTSQTGQHVSLYDGESDDWHEKKRALAYAVGINEESLFFLKIKNGGSPQKSIGIISTKDREKKYRVFIEWVDGQGWKPVQVDALHSLDFDY